MPRRRPARTASDACCGAWNRWRRNRARRLKASRRLAPRFSWLSLKTRLRFCSRASKDSGVHSGDVLKRALTGAAGRGGGNAALAQGSVPSKEALDQLLQILTDHLKLPSHEFWSVGQTPRSAADAHVGLCSRSRVRGPDAGEGARPTRRVQPSATRLSGPNVLR